MNHQLFKRLSDLLTQDERTRAELAATGELFDGYHPSMAEVHAKNAAALELIMDEFGWPGKSLVGEKGAETAWIILQHAIGNPKLQRRCLPLLQAAADAGEIPRYQPAYLEDRICCFEERPQRYGTQLDWDENGELSPLPLEDPDRVDDYRDNVGLGPLDERVKQARTEAEQEGAKPPKDLQSRKRKKTEWARSVGWFK